MTTVNCKACDAGLPLVWCVQSRKTMHQTQGLGVTSCARVDERDQRARDRGNENFRGRSGGR